MENEMKKLLEEDKANIREVVLPVSRTVEVKSVLFNNRWYARTRDIAWLLGIKQQFEFTSDIKRALGEDVILKYERTEPFRFKGDVPRTTYIEITDVIKFLNSSSIHHKMLIEKKDEFIRELKKLNRTA